MRFAYIDSNGNEVPIPSVDALALRIELGAINETTELYDAQADQWGPASTHEIFHTLSRAAEEGEHGFVAPPPPVSPFAESETTEAEGTASAEVEQVEPIPDAPTDPTDPVGELTLAPAPPDEEAEATSLDAEVADTLSGFELAGEGASAPEVQPEPVESGFDFGDLEGGLELEESFESPDHEVAEASMDFSPGAAVGGEGSSGIADEALDYTYADSGYAREEGLDLETPMSEFSPDAPPAWMEADAAEADAGEVMDFSAVSADVVGGDDVPSDVPLQGRRTPRTKPSAPKFKRQRSLGAPIVGVVVLLAVGLAAYVAWPIVSARLAGAGDTEDQAVVLPPIPEELVPQMAQVAGAAFASLFVDGRSTGSGPVAPGPDWLSGRYFANASQFDEVERFWFGVGDVLDAVRSIDLADFHDAFEGAMERAGVASDHRALLAERADSGFVAAREAREATFGVVEELVDGALGLHAFLVANEANIEYTPAATRTNDPVLEARPSSPEIGTALEDGLERVTNALGELEYRDLVTADGLWAAVLARIQEVGIQ